MSKFNEDTFKGWCVPASDTEDNKMNNAMNMIKSAIDNSNEFDDLSYEVFAQGSYANNTNVRASSDVDVCVMLKSTFYSSYLDGLTNKDYGFSDATLTYNEYKQMVIRALQAKFGYQNVTLGNKSVKIMSNSYHVEADAVVTFIYKNYKAINSRDSNKYIEGTKLVDNFGNEIINYPKIHIKNGITKNNNTNREYKKLVRIFKRIRDKMADENLINKDIITSFLVESLVWNVPNNIITGYLTWNDTVKKAIIHLYNAIKDDECKEWGEVSEYLYLFHSGRKWTKEDAKDFTLKMWSYLGYSDENN